MLNLDTHILLRAFADELTTKERKLLRAHQWSISSIVLWEMAKLIQLGRVKLDMESVEFLQAISAVHIWPLNPQVCVQSTKLDFESDPADELIAATSLVWKIPLVTRDKTIRQSKLVPFA